MFTIEQIKAAHSKVKSGADFPNYVQAIIKLGVIRYEVYVSDGHATYLGSEGFTAISDAKYATLTIADESNQELFRKALKDHQQGKSDYLTFCKICAEAGIEKWIVNMADMTCTYYDKAGNKMLVETIPAV